MSWIPKVSPHFEEPRHLSKIIELYELIANGNAGLRVVVAAPPQHCKTETFMHAMCWLMKKNPNNYMAYAFYPQDRRDRVSDQCQTIAGRAGLIAHGYKT